MKKALSKDIVRDIKKSRGRFISILCIVALGVAFFSGIKISPIDMKMTADKYYDDYNLMDIKILSTLGLTDDDVEAVKDIEGVEGVFPTYSIDALTNYKSQEIALRIHGLPLELIDNNSNDYINRVNLVEGRLPEKSGEAVIEKSKMNDLDFSIGDKVNLSSGKDDDLLNSLNKTEYEIVGIIETPYYLSYQKGSTSIGNGEIRSILMIPQEDFVIPTYTEMYVTVEGAKQLNSYKDNYFDVVGEVVDSLEDISNNRIEARYDEVISEATEELNKGKKEYETQKKDAMYKLNDAMNEIEKGKKDIEKGEYELKNKQDEFNIFVRNAESQIKNAEEELASGEAKYLEGSIAFNEGKVIAEGEFKKAEEKISEAEQGIVTLNNQILAIEEQLKSPDLTEENKLALEQQLEGMRSTLEDSTISIEQAKKDLESKKSDLLEKENELKMTKVMLDTSRKTLESKQLELDNGKKTAIEGINTGKNKIEQGKKALIEAESEYNKAKSKADEELLKAEEKIKDAEDKISEIEKPEWYVLDRKSHYSYVDYENSANSIDALAKVFPVFFFLVAALVCLTTMTRMVDEQRVNIGTLKALGYSKGKIASKYIIYALSASLVGSVIGLSIGYTILPTIVLDAYGIMYTLPPTTYVFDIPIAILITSIAVGITTMAAYYSCSKELRESPSVLMRPKAPKLGKRILLERIPLIWNRLNFTGKVTIRNIFRYKKRFFMTVFGIAGCTALLLTGFGIKDSIETIVDKQFGSIFKYDMTINLDRKISSEEKNILNNNLKSVEGIKSYDFISSQNGKVKLNNVEKSVNIIVPKDVKNFSEFIYLQNRLTKEPLSLDDEGIIVTEKVAKQLNVKVGDEISLINPNDKRVIVKISGIAENYVSNYVYMTSAYYEEVFDRRVEYKSIVATIEDTSDVAEIKLSKEIADNKSVAGVSFNSGIKDNFDNTIKSLNYVVIVMIISAGALAFVVLYNLTNVNISERIREIATIKVLGFYDKEVSAYIYRENIILTFVGTIAGLGLGVLLHKFIMITVEMDNMMFGRNVDMLSFIVSAVLTLVFAGVVNFTMYYKLKNVEMVESLKSVD